jgi:hypothetical protein
MAGAPALLLNCVYSALVGHLPSSAQVTTTVLGCPLYSSRRAVERLHVVCQGCSTVGQNPALPLPVCSPLYGHLPLACTGLTVCYVNMAPKHFTGRGWRVGRRERRGSRSGAATVTAYWSQLHSLKCGHMHIPKLEVAECGPQVLLSVRRACGRLGPSDT